VCKVLARNPEPLTRPRRRWEDNIKRDLREIVLGAWIVLVWQRAGTGGGLLLTR
jgi:hypothetical protein